MKSHRYAAAGGVVVHDNHVLVLRRPSRSEVRLPKGHIEKGETQQETALREVAEESGYTDLEIVTGLGQQVVEFDHNSRHIIRDETFFLMHLTSLRQIDRTEHELQFEPQWVNWEEALAQLTFEAECEWVRRARMRDTSKGSTYA
jgi:bis(5'-nucleosidyl)-tetraphosphatase